MAATNLTLPQTPTVEELWEIVQEQQAMLAHYHTITQETRFWAAGQKIELPKFARFDPTLSDRHDRILHQVNKADAGIVSAKTGSVRAFEFRRRQVGRT